MKNNVREKAVAFIVVRLSSSRLPGKHFRTIGNKSLLSWLTGHLQSCQEVDEIVIATVAEAVNEPLREFARENNLSCFWYEGEVDHVTTRLVRAAEQYNADICLLISGDCPLLHPPLIDSLVSCLRDNPDADIVNVDFEPGKTAALQGVQVARRRAWELAEELSESPEHKEHHFPVIAHHPDKFFFVPYRLDPGFTGQDLRLSVDTMADLDFMNQLHRELTAENKPFRLPEVLALLEAKPELKEINAHVHQRALVETIYTILIVIDSGQDFGFGHLRRCMELGMQITERLGWPVVFVVDDSFAHTLLTKKGFSVYWGAVGRPPRNNDHGAIQTFQKTSRYDAVIIDIANREIDQDWKQNFLKNIPMVIMDKTEDWTLTSDVLIVPGVTCPVSNATWSAVDHPLLLQGKEFIIIRREIRQVRAKNIKKDIDLLIYQGTEDPIDRLEDPGHLNSLTVEIVTGTAEHFPELLARSKVYLSHFGYSFYEALFLNTLPLTWSLSGEADTDVQVFNQEFSFDFPVITPDSGGMNQLCNIIKGINERTNNQKQTRQNMEPTNSEKTSNKSSPFPFSRRVDITDGTPNIIAAIKKLMAARQFPDRIRPAQYHNSLN